MNPIVFILCLYSLSAFAVNNRKYAITKTTKSSIIQTSLDNLDAKSSASHPLSSISFDPLLSITGPSPQKELRIARGYLRGEYRKNKN